MDGSRGGAVASFLLGGATAWILETTRRAQGGTLRGAARRRTRMSAHHELSAPPILNSFERTAQAIYSIINAA
jgi:hypothetical protein